MKVTEKHVFFFGGIFSNWAYINNVYGGISVWYGDTEYILPTSEHVFMAEKAWLFNDEDALRKIEVAITPRQAKLIGRQVKGFSEEVWKLHREEAMMNALKAKFRCSSKFRDELLKEEYKGKIFVEASPTDCIWGIGLSESTPYIDNVDTWKGTNLLGKLLTELRDSKL